ncbi:NADP-dependent oxidoreductase [Ilumatobacter nonamiensis]|uniref:NADP-dependent oxidoreductase n=1 Tax=Ilumatobacter nonamiensis TaxID=467093 RepID=UPI00034C3F10|nr:NADP-dependent oxidoreductase [Ilumatobacter nonamiensis]
MTTTRRVALLRRPTGPATPDHFVVEDVELDPLQPGEVRVGVEYISVDAATRTMLRGEGFHMQVGIGETILAGGVGRVVESAADEWKVGDPVVGGLGAQTISTVPGAFLNRVDDTLGPLSLHLGVLGGSTGVTAWIGIREVAKPQPGDSFVVSAAAGAVGSVAGQIAKRDGARVIGIAGGPDKVRYLLDTLGFDEAIDYKHDDVGARLGELCPDGVNGFFDNVGGPILDAVLDNIALHGKVTICGAISQYDDMDDITGPSMYLRLAERQAVMEGFAFFHFPDRMQPAMEELAGWVADGSIALGETVLDGIDRYPEALQVMFEGGNTGKLLVRAS